MMTDTSQGEFAANVTDARLRHPWVHVNRVLRVMLHTRWSKVVVRGQGGIHEDARGAE